MIICQKKIIKEGKEGKLDFSSVFVLFFRSIDDSDEYHDDNDEREHEKSLLHR
jgi:hypothetical protein